MNPKSRLSGMTNNFQMIVKEGDRNFIKENTPNLLASRRIIDSFNVGDGDGIKGIIDNATTFDCDVYIFPINRHLKGRLALLDLWESMLEVFPDGVFRVSDTTINDKGELITRFIFSGARQFNFVLGFEGGDAEAGEITSESSTNSFGDSTSTSSDDSCSQGSNSFNNTDTYDMDYSKAQNDKSNKSRKSSRSVLSPPRYEGGAPTIRVDYSCPLIRFHLIRNLLI